LYLIIRYINLSFNYFGNFYRIIVIKQVFKIIDAKLISGVNNAITRFTGKPTIISLHPLLSKPNT